MPVSSLRQPPRVSYFLVSGCCCKWRFLGAGAPGAAASLRDQPSGGPGAARPKPRGGCRRRAGGEPWLLRPGAQATGLDAMCEPWAGTRGRGGVFVRGGVLYFLPNRTLLGLGPCHTAAQFQTLFCIQHSSLFLRVMQFMALSNNLLNSCNRCVGTEGEIHSAPRGTSEISPCGVRQSPALPGQAHEVTFEVCRNRSPLTIGYP